MRVAWIGAIVRAGALWWILDAGTALAESARGDKPAAAALSARAQELMKAGKAREACPQFAESQKLDPNLGTLLNLALCYRETGQTASAWSTYTEAAALARKRKQRDREQLAKAEIAALEPKLTRLVIVVAAAQGAGFEVRRNGASVPRELWNVSVPVDPGAHSVDATAPGKIAFRQQFLLQGAGKVLRVDIPALKAMPAPAPPPAVAPASAPAPAAQRPAGPAPQAVPATPPPATTSQPVPRASERKSGSGRKVFALTLAGLGAAGVGVGTVFGLKMRSADEDARAICENPTLPCTVENVLRHNELKDEAQQARTIFYVGVGAGSAALAAGAILFLTAAESSERAAAIEPRASFGPGFASVEMRGRF